MQRFTLPAAVFLLLVRDAHVLLLRRKDTGWCDGCYDLVAGHIDGGEHMVDALLREAQEEVGVTFDRSDTRFAHLMHYLGAKEYLYVTFEVTKWDGEPKINEPEKHDDLQWFPLSQLPENLTPSSREILRSYLEGQHYSELSN